MLEGWRATKKWAPIGRWIMNVTADPALVGLCQADIASRVSEKMGAVLEEARVAAEEGRPLQDVSPVAEYLLNRYKGEPDDFDVADFNDTALRKVRQYHREGIYPGRLRE